MFLLNICFTDIISLPNKENQPLAVAGRFYAQLFGGIAKLIEEKINEVEAVDVDVVTEEVQQEIVVQHHFGTTFYVTEGGQQFTTTLSTCSCGEKNCRHTQAVNKHREGALRITLLPRVKCDGIKKLLLESTSNRKYYV